MRWLPTCAMPSEGLSQESQGTFKLLPGWPSSSDCPELESSSALARSCAAAASSAAALSSASACSAVFSGIKGISSIHPGDSNKRTCSGRPLPLHALDGV